MAKKKSIRRVRLISKSAKETQKIGARLARLLEPGDVVLMIAGLGAGKTTLVQGLAHHWGMGEALSPTFILAQTLIGKKKRVVHHLDFYRLDKSEISQLGIEDYLLGEGQIEKGVVLIEWADRCKEIWPREHLELRIKIRPRTNHREVTIKATGKKYEKKLIKLIPPLRSRGGQEGY